MRNSNITKGQKELILQWRSQGMRVPEIADKMNLSESGVYRVIQMDRVREIPTIDDSNTVKELKKLLEEKELEIQRLHKIIDKLLS